MKGQDDGLYIQENPETDALDHSNGVISNSGALGVHGIEMRISGSLGGHVGHTHFYKVNNPRVIMKEHSIISDMTAKIKSIERVHPNYTIGMNQK